MASEEGKEIMAVDDCETKDIANSNNAAPGTREAANNPNHDVDALAVSKVIDNAVGAALKLQAKQGTAAAPSSKSSSSGLAALGSKNNDNDVRGESRSSSPSHLDEHGRPLYLVDNVKGSSGNNRWMWERCKLIMPHRGETKSSRCMGAWCLRCEELGKTARECHLNYHPTRNFKAISRHFKRIHIDLQQDPSGDGDAKKKAVTATVKKPSRPPPQMSTRPHRPAKRIKIALSPRDAIPRCQILLDGKGEDRHRIISPPTFHACGEGRCIVVTEHMISVPLYRSSNKGSIDIYFAVVERVKQHSSSTTQKLFEDMVDMAPTQRAAEYVENANLSTADDMMLFLQGGPGFGAPTAVAFLGLSSGGSWAAAALDQYSRIVLMDQRGTGRSTPITKQSLARLFPDLFLLDFMDSTCSKSLEELGLSHPLEALKVENAVVGATEFLAEFRADSIAKDAEAVKDSLLCMGAAVGPTPWGCALGQSFGGFCVMTYLSKIERPPSICLLTGGIGPMLTPVYEVYSSLWQRVRERNLRYYEMYPGDIPIVKLIVKTLLEEPVPLPSGGLLTARRFLQTGIALGGGPSAFARMHSLLSGPFLDNVDEEEVGKSEVEFKTSFLKSMDSFQGYDENPFYFWLHEAIYANGPNDSHVGWAAHRAYDDIAATQREFDYQYTCSLEDNSTPTLFFGEHVFPWMIHDYEGLSGVGMKYLAEKIATKKDWGCLYDADHMRKVLGDGTCRAAAAVYYDDMYVDFNASMKVASRGGPLEKCKVWVTNEYQHSGIKDDGAKIFAKLHDMATGSIRVPS